MEENGAKDSTNRTRSGAVLNGCNDNTDSETQTRTINKTTVEEVRETIHMHVVTETSTTRAAVVMEKMEYSDLPEVVQVIPAQWDSVADSKLPVIYDRSEKIATTEADMLSPSTIDPVPAYHSSASDPTSGMNGLGQESPTRNSSGSESSCLSADEKGLEKNEVRVCGMGTKTFMCVAVGLLVFILTLLTIVLAVTLTMNTGKSSKSSTGVVRGILDNSKLAAVNWTDIYGVDRSAVFYQDVSDAIILSLRDSVSNTWAQSNVTEAVLNSTGTGRLDILSGTPLAAVTNSWQVSLYYLTTNNRVAEVWTSNIVDGDWYAGVLASTLQPQAMNGSQLAAYYQISKNSTNSLFVAFQDATGDLQLCNLTANKWEVSGPITNSSSVTPLNGTGLALRSFTDDEGLGVYGTAVNALRLYQFGGSGLYELMNGPESNFTWEDGNSGNIISEAHAVSDGVSPPLAAISYGEQGWTNMLVTYLSEDNSPIANIYNGSVWTSGTPSLTGGGSSVSNFTALATAQNMRVYGLSNGSIYEYHVKEADPLTWRFESVLASSN